MGVLPEQRGSCAETVLFYASFSPRQAPVLWLTSFVDAKWCCAACCEWNVTEWNERIFLGALCMKDHFLELFKEWTSPWKSDPIEAQIKLFQKWCFLSLLRVPIFCKCMCKGYYWRYRSFAWVALIIYNNLCFHAYALFSFRLEHFALIAAGNKTDELYISRYHCWLTRVSFQPSLTQLRRSQQ